MSDPRSNPLGPLRDVDVGDPPRWDRLAQRARARDRRRKLGAGAVALVVVAGVIGAVNLRTPDDTPDVATTPPITLPASTTAPAAEACAGDLPVFATTSPTSEPLEPGDFHGADGPAPGSVPAQDGQRVVHWLGEFDVAAEIRWPGTSLDDEASTVRVPNAHGLEITLADDPVDSRFVAVIPVDTRPGGCGVISVELLGPDEGPIVDSSLGFLAGLRPIADLPGLVAELDRENSQAPAGDRPAGRCATPIFVDGVEPTDAQILDLIDRFVADRIAGAAAELCLTVPGITSYAGSRPTERGVPALCLFECPDGTMIAARPRLSRFGGRPEALVDYEVFGGTLMNLRESYTVDVTEDGLLLITSAAIDVDSWIGERTARRVLSELLDALAAGEWDAAAATLLNEGAVVNDPRIGGEEWYTQGYDEAFSRLCATAVCGAPYTLGETLDASETFRSILVTFETADGPIEIPMDLVMFEGVTTAGTLPPDGVVDRRLPPIDERIFGEPYDARLTVIRHFSFEHRVDGGATWTRLNLFPGVGDQYGVVGGRVVVPTSTAGTGTFHLLAIDGAGGQEQIFTSESEGSLLGVGTAAGRPLAFVTGAFHRELMAIDLESGEQTRLPCDGCVEPFGDEQLGFVDAEDDHIAIGQVVGDSYFTTIYEFDPATLELGARVGFIGSEQSTGEAHLSPDGSLAAAALFPELNRPSRSIAIFDTTSGERTTTNTWTLGGDATIESLDYDGRWVVAALSDETTWVIDTHAAASGTGRIVETPARIRFG